LSAKPAGAAIAGRGVTLSRIAYFARCGRRRRDAASRQRNSGIRDICAAACRSPAVYRRSL